jgi:hypothetical protein
MRPRRALAAPLAAVLLLAAPARADEPAAVAAERPLPLEGPLAVAVADDLEPEPAGWTRATAIAAALVPGALVHGAGHWVAGERQTARRLLVWQALALGAALAGGLPIGISGGAKETMPGVALLVPGGGAFLVGWLADVYGVSGGARIGGRPERAPAPGELTVGWGYVHDAHFPGHLATAAGEAWLARARITGAGWWGEGTWQARAGAGLRLFGGTPGRPRDDGSRLDLVTGWSKERHRTAGFEVSTLELAAEGRYDLGRIGGTLAGSFASAALGLAGQRVRYHSPEEARDPTSLLIGRIGFGLYLGDGARRRAEAEVYYDHRRDGLVGGLLLPIGSNGFLGHVGAAAVAYRGDWGLAADLELGTAWVAGLGVRRRFGGAR